MIHIDSDLIRPGQLVMPQLDFRPPQCPYCLTDLDLQENTWHCESCWATWSRHGDTGTRPCVQGCDRNASLVDADGQPRCAPCVKHLDAGELDRVKPHKCTRCPQIIYGRSRRALTQTSPGQLCVECADNARLDAFLAAREADQLGRAARAEG